jgi:hypothetical protein
MIATAIIPIAIELAIGPASIIALVTVLYVSSTVAQPVFWTLADQVGPRSATDAAKLTHEGQTRRVRGLGELDKSLRPVEEGFHREAGARTSSTTQSFSAVAGSLSLEPETCARVATNFFAIVKSRGELITSAAMTTPCLR